MYELRKYGSLNLWEPKPKRENSTKRDKRFRELEVAQIPARLKVNSQDATGNDHDVSSSQSGV